MTTSTTRTPPAMHNVQLPGIILISARALTVALIVFVLSALFLPWQQTATASGRIIAFTPDERDQAIQAPVKGRITRWEVVEGQQVEKGQLLLEISDNDPEYLGRLERERAAAEDQVAAEGEAIVALERQITSLKEVRKLTIEAADARIRQANNKVQGAQLKLRAARGELETSELNISRQRELAEKGLISQRKLELTELKQIKAEAEVRNRQAELEAAKGEVLAKRAERESKAADMDAKIASVSNKLQEARSKLAKAQATLAKAETNVARQSTMQVFAPRTGTVMRVLARQGVEFVKEGDTLAILVPETDERAVELWVSGNDIPLVTNQRHVRLQFEGWPAVQFGGWPGAQAGTFAGNVAFVDARAEDSSGLFRVVVIPDPAEEPWPPGGMLRQGARANGWILLNQVTIGFEIWRQINGFPPTLPEDAAKQLGKQRSKPTKVSKNKVGKISSSLGDSTYVPSTSTSSKEGK